MEVLKSIWGQVGTVKLEHAGRPEDLTPKTETWCGKKSKRTYLKKAESDDLTESLHRYFTRTFKVPRIMHGKQQELETLINEEALLLAKYLRNERENWVPRIAMLD